MYSPYTSVKVLAVTFQKQSRVCVIDPPLQRNQRVFCSGSAESLFQTGSMPDTYIVQTVSCSDWALCTHSTQSHGPPLQWMTAAKGWNALRYSKHWRSGLCCLCLLSSALALLPGMCRGAVALLGMSSQVRVQGLEQQPNWILALAVSHFDLSKTRAR